MENSTNERQDNREMDRRTVVLKGAAVAAGALCGASAWALRLFDANGRYGGANFHG